MSTTATITTENQKKNQNTNQPNSEEFNAHEFLMGVIEETIKNIEW